MEPHLVATELFHQAVVFEPPQGLVQGRWPFAVVATNRDTGQQPESLVRYDGRFRKLAGGQQQAPGVLIVQSVPLLAKRGLDRVFVNALELVVGELLCLDIHNGQPALPFQTVAVAGKRHETWLVRIGPFSQVGSRQLQRQRQAAQHPGDGDRGFMVGIAGFERRLAFGMAKQKLERGFFRKDSDLDRREPAQVTAARGEQQPAREPGRNATRDDGPVQGSRVLEVIKNEQCLFPPAERTCWSSGWSVLATPRSRASRAKP